MAKKIMRLAAALLLAGGIAVLLIPPAGQRLYRREAETVIRQYDQRIEEQLLEEPDALEELYRAVVRYNEELFQSGQADLVDPFSYEQVAFSLKRFGFEEELIGHVRIPKMEVSLPIYLGANKENMSRGATHLTQTSLPVGGANTNAVLCAHRGMGTAAMFRDIHLLEIGDEVILTNFRETLVYKVVETGVILPTGVDSILIQPGRDLVTLLTCHPYGYNSQRYVVYCERVE